MNAGGSAATSQAPDWFRQPAAPFRTATFWFWHRIPTDEEIRAQLADMQAKGLGAVMIQARPALARTAYLSPPYLAACRLACAEARRLGLIVTLYDEYGWMSGHGGGRTVEGADHLRERHMFWASGAADGPALSVSGIHAPFFSFLGETGRDWLYEGGVPRWGEWRSILALAHPPEVTGPQDIRRLDGARIEETGPDSCRIAPVSRDPLPPGWQVTAFVSARCLTSRLINYLLPEAAERFAATSYAPLVEAAGGAAGGAADALFFDHPYAGFYVWNERGVPMEGTPMGGTLGNSLPCDGTLADPANAAALLALTRAVGPETARLRADYLSRHGARLHDAFFGTLARWTRERGLGFTGHELLTHVGGWALSGDLKGFDPRSMPGVDYFGIDAFRTHTTVDAADYRPQIAARFGDSVARANGRKRCTVEQYATGREIGLPALAGQWSLTPSTFRRQAMRHLISGARRILLHAVNVTDGTEDERLLVNPRFDFPPAFNFEPWWEDCPALFTELARFSAFLEEGEPLRPVALFYPLHTLRAHGPAHICGAVFGLWAQQLAEAGIGYTIVDEATLAAALGEGTTTLVLPAVTLFERVETTEVITRFLRRGGRVLLSGAEAAGLDERTRLSLLAAGVEGRPDASPDGVRAALAGLERPLPDVRVDDGAPIWCTVLRVGQDVGQDVGEDGDDTWRVAVLNDTAEARSVRLRLPASLTAAESWCAATGERAALPLEGNQLHLDVPPEAVRCLVLRAGDPRRAGEPAPAPAMPAPPRLLHSLTLAEGWSLEAAGAPPVPIRVDRGWESQGFARFSGTGIYRCTLTLRLPRAAGAFWQLVLPQVHETAELWIDGRFIARYLAGEARFDLPLWQGASCAIELRVRNTAANRYYGGTSFARQPFPSGLTAPPRLEAWGRLS